MVSARLMVLAGVASAATALTGCTGTPHKSAVTDVAHGFVQKLQDGDGQAACDLLTDDARSSVSGATDALCADAIKGVQEDGSGIAGVQVWGDAAQVRIGGDVLFLRLVSGEWKVSAAGCEPRPERPYDCKVGG